MPAALTVLVTTSEDDQLSIITAAARAVADSGMNPSPPPLQPGQGKVGGLKTYVAAASARSRLRPLTLQASNTYARPANVARPGAPTTTILPEMATE